MRANLRVKVAGWMLRRSIVLLSVMGWSMVGGMAQQVSTGQAQTAAQAAETGQAGAYSLQVKSQLVVLDVVVTNKKGQAVGNLTRDSFKVYENKVQQPILTFEAATRPAPGFGAGAPIAIHSTEDLDRLEPQAPVSIIVLDEVTTKFEDEAFARYSLKKYLNTEGDMLQQPTMLIAVSIDHEMVLHDYTTSKKEILDALDRHFAGNDWRAKSASWKAEQFGAAFASLEGVAEATAGHPGHKNIVWVGRGFPSFRWDQLPPKMVDQLQQAIATCTNLLRDGRVTLYSVDPVGISAEPPATDEDGFYVDDPFGGQVDFDDMARATGGQAFHGRNDVDHLIGSSVSDGETFYTITYKPAVMSSDPKEFRKIQVMMADRSLTATTREGYFVSSAPVAPMLDAKGKISGQVAFDMAMASDGLMVYDGVPLTIERMTDNQDDFRVSFPANSLEWKMDEDKQKSDVTIVMESYDKKGKLLNRKANLLAFGLPALKDGQQETRMVRLKETATTAAPAARIRVIVRSNANGKIGADNFFLVDRRTLSDPATGLKPMK